MPRVVIQTKAFDIGNETAVLKAKSSAIGAICCFTGYVRDINQGESVTGLELEHYSGMAEREIEIILKEAEQRWLLQAVRVVHRVGRLSLGEAIVFVGVASEHRGDAFSACEYIMDYLKTRAPFWKKECHIDGSSVWLDARDSDTDKLKKWVPES